MEETHCVPFLVIIKQSEMGLIIFPCYLPKNKAKVPSCYMILESRHISTSKTYNCPKYQRLIISFVFSIQNFREKCHGMVLLMMRTKYLLV